MIQQKHLSSSDDSDDQDTVQELDKNKLIANNKAKVARTSVSAEAYGQFNKKGSFQPKVVKKTQEQIARIRSRLSQAFMFQALDEIDLKIVIDAMEEKKFKSGEKIITQGEDGEYLYVVDQGELNCTKILKKGEQPTFLKTYKPGESFGELALLYNAPRAATIIAQTDSILLSLDRDTFNNIVKSAASKKREYYEVFLGKVELLQDMDPYERLQIADALKSIQYAKGDYIIKQGETGTTFYLLQEGQALATKTTQAGNKIKIMKIQGSPPEVVYKYKAGDYFGELSLLKHEPRAANIVAETNCICVSLDSASFRRLCGPIEDILKRNTARYAKFVQQ